MDLVFSCTACQGILIAHSRFRGLVVACSHCDQSHEFIHGRPVTERLVDEFLDFTASPAFGRGRLRRARPFGKTLRMPPPRMALTRTARISLAAA